MTTQVTRSGPSASAAISATSAESIPPETRDQDALEAVLGRRSRAGRARAPRRPRRPREQRGWRRRRCAARRRRACETAGAPGPGGEPPRPRRDDPARELEVADDAAPRSNWAARASHLARRPSTTRLWPSKTSSSCPPTRLQSANAAPVSRGALGEHPLALGALAAVIGGGRRVDDQARAGQRLDRRRRAREPDVLADRQPDRGPAELDQRRGRTGLEVAPLVEDPVVGEQHLAVDALDAAVGEHGEPSCGRAAFGSANPTRATIPSTSAASASSAAPPASRKWRFSHRSSAG